MAKIKMKKCADDITIRKVFNAFVISKTAEEVKEKSICI